MAGANLVYVPAALVRGTIVVAGQAPALRVYDLKEGTAAGEVPAGAEVADAPHALEDPSTKLPMLLVVTHDIVKGAAAVLVMRSVDPVMVSRRPMIVWMFSSAFTPCRVAISTSRPSR